MISVADLFLYVGAGGFVLGVLAGSFIAIPPLYSLVIGVVIFLFSFSVRYFGKHKDRILIGGIFFVVFFSLGTVRFSTTKGVPNETLTSFENRRIGLVGTIVREPDERLSGTLLTLDNLSFGVDGLGKSLEGRVLVRSPKYPAYVYGDRVSVSGIVEKPKAFETGEGRMFDYEGYLDRFGISHVINRPVIERIGEGEGNPIIALLLAFKRTLLQSSARVIPAPQSELLGGIIFGSQRGMPEETILEFRRAGLVHVVVLSGYNLSVVADWIMRIAHVLPRTLGLSLGALSIVLYALMAGASATAVRASVMALLVIFAQASRRTYNVSRALVVAGVAMIAVNPKVLVFDRSFQLSFLATIAVIYVSPLIEPTLTFITERLGMRAIVSSTLATNILVLPLILYMSGMFPLLSLPANVLVLPLVPAAMLFGMVTSVVGLFGGSLAIPFGFITNLFLSWIIMVASWFGRETFVITLPAFPVAWVIAVYVGMAIIIVRLYQKRKKPALVRELFPNEERENC
jgi:competence protein ComEC